MYHVHVYRGRSHSCRRATQHSNATIHNMQESDPLHSHSMPSLAIHQISSRLIAHSLPSSSSSTSSSCCCCCFFSCRVSSTFRFLLAVFVVVVFPATTYPVISHPVMTGFPVVVDVMVNCILCVNTKSNACVGVD